MALLPLLSELLNDTRLQPAVDLYDPFTLRSSLYNNLLRNHFGIMRPWRGFASGDVGLSAAQTDKNEFRVNIDVQQFKPEELKVKVDNGFIVVDGKHEERSDQHGFISRQFTRRYKIPEDVDETALVSNLSSDGVLTLRAPKKALPNATSREIPITHTNQPAVEVKEPEKIEEKKEDKQEQ